MEAWVVAVIVANGRAPTLYLLQALPLSLTEVLSQQPGTQLGNAIDPGPLVAPCSPRGGMGTQTQTPRWEASLARRRGTVQIRPKEPGQKRKEH